MYLQNLMTANTTAEMLCVTNNTLAKWRISGGGPKFITIGRRIAYDPADVTEWVDARRFSSTTEAEASGLN